MFLPSLTIKTISSSLPSSYDLSYTNLSNNGSPLQPMLLFNNLKITKNSSTIFEAKKIGIGFPLSFALILGHIEINNIQVEEAFIFNDQSNLKSLLPFKIRPSKKISIDIEEFLISNLESRILLNGRLNSVLPGIANGYFNMLHGEQISNFSISSDGTTSNFLLNLKEFNWLKFFSNPIYKPFSSIHMGASLIGSINAQGSSIEGSLKYQETNFGNFELQKNYGSFVFQSNHHEATLLFKEFLQPFVDEEYPIQFNLKKKSIAIPQVFLNEELIRQYKPRISNIALKNLLISFNQGDFMYTSEVTDLDLLDVYFSEILNLKGGISGINKEINFSIASNQSVAKQNSGSYYPLTINAKGSLINKVFNLNAHINDLIGHLNLILNFSLDQREQFELQASGKNLSKNIILTSIPESLKTTKNFINTNVKPGKINNFFLEYSQLSEAQDQNLIIKLDIDNMALAYSPGLNFVFTKNLVEIQNDNLYFVSSPGTVNGFPISSMVSSLNFSNQLLRYSSIHDFSNYDNQRLLKNSFLAESNIVTEVKSKGQLSLMSQEHHNILSINVQDFTIPLNQKHTLHSRDTQMLISNFNQLNGLMYGKLLDQNMPISFHGKNLLDAYEIDFETEILLNPQDLIPKTSFLKLSGHDTFLLKLSIHSNNSPMLTIFSDFKGVEFLSDYSFLTKSKSSILPTQISVSNFSNPEVYLFNELVELHLKSFKDLKGYISIGRKLPIEFSYLKQAESLNVYLGLDELTSQIIESWTLPKAMPQSIPIKNFIIDIQNLEILSNQYNKVTGIFLKEGKDLAGTIKSNNLDAVIRQDSSGFLRLVLNNTHIPDASFLSLNSASGNIPDINARLTMNNSSLGDLKIESLDMYLVKKKDLLTLNNINLQSNLLSISPLWDKANAYFSFDNREQLYKLRGSYLVKDSFRIPIVQNLANFSYFNGDINLQWKDLQKLQNIEGSVDFILKDLLVENKSSSSVAFNLLGVLNLKNILGKVANLDLTMSEFTSTQLNRVEGNLIFSKSKARLASPIFIETNAAKMKWIGHIKKNNKGELSELDLNLDLRVRIGENIPWYAALLGGLPAIAGSAVISEIFETNLDSLSNYQYEVSGFLAEPKIERIN